MKQYSGSYREGLQKVFKDKGLAEEFGTPKISLKTDSYIDKEGKKWVTASYWNKIDELFGAEKEEDVETLRRAIVVEERPDVTFDQIGGQEEAVKEARRLSNQLKHPEVFQRWGVPPPRGVLFYGEPGNGKTLIAKALAHEAESAFVYIKAPDLASKWYGDAEKLARGVFKVARSEAEKRGHCIMFLDEVDSLLPSRTERTHEATRKVIGTFLQEIDGLQTKSGISVVASTNRPEDVDPAFLSRMTNWIEVPPPNPSGIAEIFTIHFQKAAQNAGRDLIENSINFASLAQDLNGVSGRDIADIVQIVLAKKAQEELEGNGSRYVSEEDIRNAINSSAKVREAKRRQRKSGSIGFTSH